MEERGGLQGRSNRSEQMDGTDEAFILIVVAF
jgi:hypothetical protein